MRAKNGSRVARVGEVRVSTSEISGNGRKRWTVVAARRNEKDGAKAPVVVIHLSLNIGITRMPVPPTFIPRGASIHTEIFGRLPGTRHSSRRSPPFLLSLSSHKEGKTR